MRGAWKFQLKRSAAPAQLECEALEADMLDGAFGGNEDSIQDIEHATAEVTCSSYPILFLFTPDELAAKFSDRRFPVKELRLCFHRENLWDYD